MPLIKRELSSPSTALSSPSADDFAAHVAALGSADAEVRWRAARALSGDAKAVPVLAASLAVEQTVRVREVIMTALMRVGDAASIAALLPLMRSQDAGQRGAAIEALQSLPETVSPFLATLLRDEDSDVRLLATELARNMSASDATKLLCDLLENEQHANVCAAAVEVLAELGTRDAIPMLEMCAKRFVSTPFLPFAIAVAIDNISGANA